MLTVVYFVKTNRKNDAPEGGWRNDIYTRSLRKIGFIDSRASREARFPQPREHWLVEIVRENLSPTEGGCFILMPIKYIPVAETFPLIVGKYAQRISDKSIILEPESTDKYWVMTPHAKECILKENPQVNSLVINHGGSSSWPKRRPADAILAAHASRLPCT